MRARIVMSGVFLVAAAGWVCADVLPVFPDPGPNPKPRPHPGPGPVPQLAAMPPPNASAILIEVSDKVQQATLVIPKPFLERVSAAEPARRQETIEVVGLHLEHLLPALALALGGLCLLRGRTRLAFAAALLLTVGVTLGVGRSRLEATPPMTQIRLGEVVLDDVKIVVSPEWGEVKLTLPPAVAARFRIPAKAGG
jgi:hypothetical protein